MTAFSTHGLHHHTRTTSFASRIWQWSQQLSRSIRFSRIFAPAYGTVTLLLRLSSKKRSLSNSNWDDKALVSCEAQVVLAHADNRRDRLSGCKCSSFACKFATI